LNIIAAAVKDSLNVLQTEKLIDSEIKKIMGVSSGSFPPAIDFMARKNIRNYRIFMNTISRALDMISKSGVTTHTSHTEYDDYFEYVIRVDK
jgi:hypothetical protein